MDFLKRLFKAKWQTVYFTNNLEEYLRIKHKLNTSGIQTKTKVQINNIRGRGGHGLWTRYGTVRNNREILVRAEEINKAYEIIHHTY